MISPKTYLTNPWVWAVALVLPPTFFPDIDITVSSWFFDPAITFFPARDLAWAEWVRRDWPFTVFGFMAACVGLWAWGALTKRPIFGLTDMTTLYLALSLTIGPGLLVNLVLKDNWGRPRPATITQFGGALDYRPPVLPGGPCPKNCAFPSGHASLGFWLAAPASLARPRWRRKIVAGAILIGLGIGVIRIAQGGHFLSDVLYAGLITLATTHILYRYFVMPSRDRHPPP